MHLFGHSVYVANIRAILGAYGKSEGEKIALFYCNNY